MKKNFLTYIVLSLIAIPSFWAQKNKAEIKLNSVAEQMAAYQSMHIKFKYSLVNKEADISQSNYGDLVVKGEQFKMNVMGNMFINNGSKTYVVNNEDQEVNVIDNQEDESLLTPKKMLFFFQDGYRYKWLGSQTKNGLNLTTVQLIPIDSESDIKHVNVDIDSKTNKLKHITYVDLNDTVTSYEIIKFEHNQPVSNNSFAFNVKNYEAKGYYINE